MSRSMDQGCEPLALTAIANQGRELVAALGEAYLAQHFVPHCAADDPLFITARLEGDARGCCPRILLDPYLLCERAPSATSLAADLGHVLKVMRERPQAFLRLYERLDDRDGFVELAEELGLTEAAAARCGGGLLALVVVLVACVVLTGCPSPGPAKCPVGDPVTGLRCLKPNGHVPGGPGSHGNNANGINRSG